MTDFNETSINRDSGGKFADKVLTAGATIDLAESAPLSGEQQMASADVDFGGFEKRVTASKTEGGYHWNIKFGQAYGLSVVRHRRSIGGPEGLFEVAITDAKGKLVSGVQPQGCLTEAEVTRLGIEVSGGNVASFTRCDGCGDIVKAYTSNFNDRLCGECEEEIVDHANGDHEDDPHADCPDC